MNGKRARKSARPFVFVCAIGMAVALLAGAAAAVELPGKGEQAVTYVPDTLVVKFKDGGGEKSRTAVLSRVSAVEVRRLEHVGLSVLRVPAAGLDSAAAALAEDPAVVLAEKVPIYHYQLTPPDPDFGEQWPLENTGQFMGVPDADIDATDAWDIEDGTSNTIVVAVIDSGVDLGHPDLASSIWTNPGEDAWSDPLDPTTGDGIDNDGNGLVDDWKGWDYVGASVLLPSPDNDPTDMLGHGTHVSGIVAAASNSAGGVGVNFHAKIIPMKIGDNGQGLNSLMAIEAINDLIELKTRPVNGEPNLRVINASWGGILPLTAMQTAIDAAGAAGILFVCAAGNGGSDGEGDDIDNPPFLQGNWPAAFDSDSIVAVAATDYNDGIAGFSNFGPVSVDLGAPGVLYFSTMPTYEVVLNTEYGYEMNYDHLSGTSMASPCVAGAASLLLAADPSLTVCEVKSLLMEYTDPAAALDGITVTGGRLNLDSAIQGTPVDTDGDGNPDVCDDDDDDDGCPDALDPAPLVASPDADGDDYGSDCDCDETNPDVNPGMTEIQNNGIDDDCDPSTPDAPVCGTTVRGYPDGTGARVHINLLAAFLLPVGMVFLLRGIRRRRRG